MKTSRSSRINILRTRRLTIVLFKVYVIPINELKLVWKELVKENKDFFEAYEQKLVKNEQISEEETNQMIQNIISGSSDD